MEPLKPCPFCENNDVCLKQREQGYLRWVFCNQCEAEGPPKRSDKEAIRNWNVRTPDILAVLDEPASLETIAKAIYSSRGEKFTYEQVKEFATKDGYVTAKCCMSQLIDETKAAIQAIKHMAEEEL